METKDYYFWQTSLIRNWQQFSQLCQQQSTCLTVICDLTFSKLLHHLKDSLCVSKTLQRTAKETRHSHIRFLAEVPKEEKYNRKRVQFWFQTCSTFIRKLFNEIKIYEEGQFYEGYKRKPHLHHWIDQYATLLMWHTLGWWKQKEKAKTT